MRVSKLFVVMSLALAMPLAVLAQQPQTQVQIQPQAQTQGNSTTSTLQLTVEKIVSQEQAEMEMLHQYSPLVETYIQQLRPDGTSDPQPAGDQYFLGRAVLAKDVDIEPLTGRDPKSFRQKVSNVGSMFTMSMQFLPRGFLQMIYLDRDGFDQQHYKFEYVRQEFLGEIRCLVFDVTPLPRTGKGRFIGRIWVEDQGYHIVRFNGAYNGTSATNYYFHFDSWRENATNDKWLPAFIYSEESNLHYAVSKRLMFKAQTRLWGYDLGQLREESELSKVLVEAQTPVQDQTDTAHDLSPVQAQRAWDRQAEDNVTERMERIGLLAPQGEVDKVLDTVINNLEVTNNLDIEPEIRCRVLMTSTLEAFDIGHTIVLSRGLIDVLPDEASLGAVLAHELAHVVLNHRIDTQYAFFDRMVFDDKDTFRHFGFARTPQEEDEANDKAVELLAKSPYKDQLQTAELFLQELSQRQTQIPNLISAHLGDRVPVSLAVTSVATAAPQTTDGKQTAANANNSGAKIVALPLGGRIKIDPWTDKLEMLKSKPVGVVAANEQMPFEVTPFILYLTRDIDTPDQSQAGTAVSAKSEADPKDAPSNAAESDPR